MNYPMRYKYRGLRSHIHWMRDVMRWRKENKEVIARLGTGYLARKPVQLLTNTIR